MSKKIIFLLISLALISANLKDVCLEMRASYYSRKHQGRLTASGQKYDSAKLTAASNRFPLGTKVEVCHQDKCVIVEVNDRINKRYSSRIDLSKKAFKTLAITDLGLIPVTVQQL